jgi:hypothetical protein
VRSLLGGHEPKPLGTVTYYMNHLQRLVAEDDIG